MLGNPDTRRAGEVSLVEVYCSTVETYKNRTALGAQKFLTYGITL